jgi:linoleate 10R-lipoxygenase
VLLSNLAELTLTSFSVGNLAHVHFAANIFSLPLKTEENPRGIFSEQELWMLMSVIFTAIFFDFEPTKSFPLRMVAQKLATMLGKLIEAYVTGVTATSFAPNLIDGFRENRNALADYGIHMIRRLVESGLAPYEIAFSQVMPTAIAMVPNQSQVVSRARQIFFSPGQF